MTWMAGIICLTLTLLPAGMAHAQCGGTAARVYCTGLDPNGWDAALAANGASTTLIVQPDAQVRNGIFLDGGDTVLVKPGGVVNSGEMQWAISGTASQVTNFGMLNAVGDIGEHGIYDAIYAFNTAHGVIHALGGVSTGVGILLGCDGVAINDGAIEASGVLIAAGLASVFSPKAQFTNNGDISVTSESLAVGIQCDSCTASQATNTGTIEASGPSAAYGIQSLYSGSMEVTNSGTIAATGAEGIGIGLEYSNGQIANNGTVSGSTAAIRQSDGGLTLAVTNSGTLNGDVLLDDGDDSFTAEGGAINGMLDGGAGFDTLTFAFEVSGAEYAALASRLAAASPTGGSLTYGGATYTWVNFEEIVDHLSETPGVVPTTGSLVSSASPAAGEEAVYVPPSACGSGAFADGRLNGHDVTASAIVYPYAVGGIDLYTPQGEWAVRAESGAIHAALAQAEASGAPVEIGARLGLALVAQPNGSLLATGPGYAFAFIPAECGIDL